MLPPFLIQMQKDAEVAASEQATGPPAAPGNAAVQSSAQHGVGPAVLCLASNTKIRKCQVAFRNLPAACVYGTICAVSFYSRQLERTSIILHFSRS